MALFDDLISDVSSRFNLGSKAGPLIQELLRLMVGQPGGINGFLDKFKMAGLESQVATWLGRTDGVQLQGHQVAQALGATTIGAIAARLGLDSGLVQTVWGYALPKVMGLLTPGGIVPSTIPASVSSFLGPAAPYPREQAASYQREQMVTRRPEPARTMSQLPRWLIPAAAALAVVAGLGYLLSGRTEHGTTTSAPPTPSVTQTIPAAPTPSRLALSNDDGVIT